MPSLRAFLSGRRSGTGAAPPLPCPSQPVCVVGDLHGRLDLLERMLGAIAARTGEGAHRTVIAGDMVDRGPDSAAILRRLSEMNRAAPDKVICLMGNHERMMLDFLEAPARKGPLWLSNGGEATLASFGLSPWARADRAGADERLTRLAAALAAAMGDDLRQWLRTLPLVWQEGDLAVIHAGADPRKTLAEQTERTCLWGHPEFMRQPRRDGLWIVHGHTIVPEAHEEAGRIAVDTGAWRTNRLSAAWLDGDGLDFIEVQTL